MYINSNLCKEMIDVKLLLLHNETWDHFTWCKRNEHKKYNKEMCLPIIYFVYM